MNLFGALDGGAFLPALFAAVPAVPKNLPSADQLPFSWFDIVAGAVLVFGLFRGRKRGMSGELLDVFQWLLIVVVSALYYGFLAQLVSQFTGMPMLISNVLCYGTIAVGIKVAFSVIKRVVGDKVVGSDLFGRMEFYLGMLAGMIRYACMLMVVLAVANARYFTMEQIQASQKKQQAEYGSEFLPSTMEIQYGMLQQSLLGRFVKKHLSEELITPMVYAPPPPAAAAGRDNIGKQRQRSVDEVVGGKK